MKYIKKFNKEEIEIYNICCSESVDYDRINYLLKNGAEKVDQIIAQYKDKIKNADKQNEKDDYSISTREIGTATMGIAIGNKKTGQKILRADAQQDLSIQQG